VNQKRPVNLDLTTMKFPVMAIVSIFHRLSGLVIFLLLPLIICYLGHSLKSVESYNQLQTTLSNPLPKLLVWAFSVAVVYHLLAGIRHMIMDIGYGETLCASRRSAILIIGLTVILTLFLGIWIW
jgi:succinate dehydrogenase / fumarate reductase cytochrome b subunit